MTRTHVPWKGVGILKCVVEYKINPKALSSTRKPTVRMD